MRLTIGVLLSK